MSNILKAMRKESPSGTPRSVDVPRVETSNLFPRPDSEQAREFEQLADSLIHLHGGSGGQIVVFSSTASGEGSSYVSFNCARFLTALLDRKVAWVDANIGSPQRRLQTGELGFRDLLVDPARFPDYDTTPEMVVVGSGEQSIKATELLSGPNYPRLLEKFREAFHFTVIDAPAILESADVAHLAEPTLGLVLVVQAKRLKHEVISSGLEKLRNRDVDVLGTVINRRTFSIPDSLYKRM
ncbi:MAG: CpsD/CapB family tyrosine-protein kinase [bacterium]|nr:CpsD/CapB family tyrosine-protein kinase [bacterium]